MMTRDLLVQRHLNVAGFRRAAMRVLPRPVFDFTDGGAEDEVTLRRNEAAFREPTLLPRPLQGVGDRDLSVDMFGTRLAMPVLIGPTGLSGMLWPDGELHSHRAAVSEGTGFCLSHASTVPIEALPKSGHRWMQVFVYRDRAFTRALADRAQAAGYDALVLTIDNQALGLRERDVVNGFSIPPKLKAQVIRSMAIRPAWLWRMRERRDFTFANYAEIAGGADRNTLAGRMNALLDPTMSWADVAMLRKHWQGPLILKGVLHPADIQIAIDHGVDGVIVSNHGGRQLDKAAAGLDALPAVAEAARGRLKVLLDGGIRRGVDVLIAKAMGADACLIARPQLWGLAVGGEAGVAAVLEILRRDLDRALTLCGVSRFADVDASLLAPGIVPSIRPKAIAA
ncbi:MAG TPA: alpha-hydroxy acid oxidase [Geminicoccus sp.]|jgi:L-lactate dehydrogenase (cytochrome)/(S)-mandelate dehydrogenase|uniref:alpha-hydroxy acid oxidase n=1 Tax=Geminicoccus sp. TaxID=2024832 RepID=UPI002E32E5B6|nr:alpha-hydroxy acid oxidase [Geminicoccus sp.]HEX2526717.1 alpha-hydroxy acid oxidase [Geminicoccus sp.]